MKKIISIALLSIFFTGCKTTSKTTVTDYSKLNGKWELFYINIPEKNYNDLFKNQRKPYLQFNTDQKMVTGNNSCNSISGRYNIEGNTINFNSPMTATKMYCQDGLGEQTFMSSLSESNNYKIENNGNTLHFMNKKKILMSFSKK